MDDCKPNRRNHDVELDAFRELMEERDRRYKSQFDAQERAVVAAFSAQKEAIQKAEAAQNSYNVGHNDLTRKMDSQYQQMLPRTEADNRFNSMSEKIEDVKKEARDWTRWLVPVVISLLSLAAAIAVLLKK